MSASDEDESPSICTRERDYFEIRVVRNKPRCVCSCRDPDPNRPTRDWPDNRCKCVDPENDCYVDHYSGKCGCECDDCAECDCDCVLLARLERAGRDDDHPEWTVDHRVRRFVRPVLMRDPQVDIEEQKRKSKYEEKAEEQQSEMKQRPKTGAKETPPKQTPGKR